MSGKPIRSQATPFWLALFVFFSIAMAMPTTGFAQSTLDLMEEEKRPPKAAELKCTDLDEEDQEKADAIDKEKAFFEDLLFECEEDWFAAENGFAKTLMKLGQESFRKYGNAHSKQKTIRLRKLTLHDRGDYRLTRFDCNYVEGDKIWEMKSIGGSFLLQSKNRWHKPDNGRWLMKLSGADCTFIKEWFDETGPDDINERLPADLNGDIILHGSWSITEYVNEDGYSHLFHRDSQPKAPVEASDKAEAVLSRIINYLEDRTKETGRKSAIK